MALPFLVFIFAVCSATTVRAQAISGFNLGYLYDPDAEINLTLFPVRQGKSTLVHYKFSVNARDYKAGDYELKWEKRSSVNVRSGIEVQPDLRELEVQDKFIKANFLVENDDKVFFLVGTITNKVNKGSWNFYTAIDPLWPITFSLSDASNTAVLSSAIPVNQRYTVRNHTAAKKIFAFYYRQAFAPAPPPFIKKSSEDKILKADSSFVLVDDSFIPSKPGLYLLQQDTLAPEGLSVLATVASFPKYNRVEQLTGPLTYLTSSPEQTSLMDAGGDKSKFDKVILGITRDASRAKNLIRSYFSRIELANRFFSAHKEGWKTDRGMIYVVFGPPTEVSRTTMNEIWFYKDTRQKFVFYRSGSVYSPDYYFMERGEQYTTPWYSTVDLWRKARF
ncbi:MAG: GWxTD domain-containing protein [Bacteroidetes bacterium]|nr:GWxTD domain-containing protein [Bacteroidota bacterium]